MRFDTVTLFVSQLKYGKKIAQTRYHNLYTSHVRLIAFELPQSHCSHVILSVIVSQSNSSFLLLCYYFYFIFFSNPYSILLLGTFFFFFIFKMQLGTFMEKM